MNDEIKEIKVNKANKSITFINNGIAFLQFGVADEILDLITNLQEELKGYKQERENLFKTIHDLQKEFKGLKEVNNYSKRELYKINKDRLEANLKLVEENERLKNRNEFLNQVCVGFDDKYEDYKSRCEKAIEYNYELQERYCHSALFDNLVASKVYEITEKQLNILNGSDKDE